MIGTTMAGAAVVSMRAGTVAAGATAIRPPGGMPADTQEPTAVEVITEATGTAEGASMVEEGFMVVAGSTVEDTDKG